MVTDVRNYLFDKRILKSASFEIPVISVGNLTAGGTGKTPHIEYLIQLLQYVYKVGTLSRGYGRKSHGFVLAKSGINAELIGDEPMQFKAKFPETVVAVAEDRVIGIPRMLHEVPETDVILLDDAFQHRAVRAGLSILLTEYNHLFTQDELLPVGWLREAKHNYHRADILIVTKCPTHLSSEEKEKIRKELNPFSYQKVYFSTITYGVIYPLFSENREQKPENRSQKLEDSQQATNSWQQTTDILLVSGIAKSVQLKKYLKEKFNRVFTREYKDHHNFDQYDLEAIRDTLKNIDSENKMIVTTEKDAVRLALHANWFLQNKIQIFVQPIRVEFLDADGEKFNAAIQKYIDVTKSKLITHPTED